MKDFIAGFQKRAYDYTHEAAKQEDFFRRRAQQTPSDPSHDAGVGAMVGAGGGFAVGGIIGGVRPPSGAGVRSRLLSSLAGGGIGAALGGLLGAGAGWTGAIIDNVGIANAKKIMKMRKAERDAYLRSLAHKQEITEREFQEWSRNLDDERRHRELLEAIRARGG